MTLRRLAVPALAALLSVTALAASPTDIPGAVAALAEGHITAATLRAPIRILASDEFEGRGPATRGDALTRLYLSTELETLGLRPGGQNLDKSGGWEQAFDIVGIKAKLPATWDFTGKNGPVSLKLS